MHARIDDHRLWYERAGESGTPVMLIMGFGISGRAWAPQVRALQAVHRVCYFDNRGIGESESSKTDYTFADLARDCAGLMDHVGFERAHVVGVSMGGMIAQHLAIRYPERLRSLTLIATHPGGPLRKTLPFPRGLGLFLRANTARGEKRLAALRRLLYTPTFLRAVDPASDFEGESIEIFAVPADTVTRVNQVRAILKHDVTTSLRSLSVPTLVIRPGQDVLVRPTNSDRLVALIPTARVLRLDDAGHGVTHQCADRVNAALLEHFAHVDRAAQAA